MTGPGSNKYFVPPLPTPFWPDTKALNVESLKHDHQTKTYSMVPGYEISFWRVIWTGILRLLPEKFPIPGEREGGRLHSPENFNSPPGVYSSYNDGSYNKSVDSEDLMWENPLIACLPSKDCSVSTSTSTPITNCCRDDTPSPWASRAKEQAWSNSWDWQNGIPDTFTWLFGMNSDDR